MNATSPAIGHNQPPADAVERVRWFDGATARIFRRSRSVTSSAAPRRKPWVLCFERRTPPEIDPLTGWTGGDDTLNQVTLTFDTLDEAIRYAEQQRIAYRVEGEALPSSGEERRRPEERPHDQARELYSTIAALAYLDPRYGIAAVGVRPDLDRALINPAAVFSSPQEVLHDATLSLDDKRELLRRWAWDAWLLEVAANEGMTQGEPSRFDEVRAAMLVLDGLQHGAVLVGSQTKGSNWHRQRS